MKKTELIAGGRRSDRAPEPVPPAAPKPPSADEAPPEVSASAPAYVAFVRCFNEQHYFEAHEALEPLWLASRDTVAEASFYKGLIQVAGAFVHLQRQFYQPLPAPEQRLYPAVRLFELAEVNLKPWRPRHLQLDVAALQAACRSFAERVAEGDFKRNPWRPDAAPRMLLGEG